jgi:diguanylate cyclase (GGDEF)-like protein/PAS domain S-box-containing protein
MVRPKETVPGRNVDAPTWIGAVRNPDSCLLLESMTNGYAYCHMVYDEQGIPGDWVHIAVNPAFVRLTGLRDVVGRTMSEVMPGFRDSCPLFFETCARVASGHGSETVEFECRPLSMWLHTVVSSPAPGRFFAVFEDISERQRTDDALVLAQRSLDCSGDMIHWVAADGSILYASDSSVKRLGYSREELMGLTVLHLDPTMTQERWAEHWLELEAAGSITFETVHRTKGGEVFPVEITATHLEHDGKDYNFSFSRDISERKELESSLRLTQLSVDRAADLIHWVDASGNLVYVSDSTCARHGYSREELLRMTIFDLDPVLTRTTWDAHWQNLKEQGSARSEAVHLTKDGELFPVEVVRNYVCQGPVELDFIFARDISRRKKAEQELNRTRVALEGRNRELEEANRRVEEANAELRAARDALAVQARTDALTGCLNRGAVLARLEEESVRSDREATPLAVGMLDIDHFKSINDTYGHPVGDAVLREVVARSLAALRSYDVFGRFGGEEFLMIVTSANSRTAAWIFERVRAAIASSPVVVDGQPIRVTVSIGGTARRAQTAEETIRLADAALYTAKERGRNRVEMATNRRPVGAPSKRIVAA